MNVEQVLLQLLPVGMLRSLGDHHYDTRKAAALNLQEQVAQWQSAGQALSAPQLIEGLRRTTRSPDANARKGSLMALAAVAFGVAKADGTEANSPVLAPLLKPLVGAILHAFDALNEPNARVRYYACEAMFNVSQVARAALLTHFDPIFDGLKKLFSDVDVDVKRGAELLDRSMKDIVIENAAAFDVCGFVAHLHHRQYFASANPHVRNLVIGWIQVLHDAPAIDALDWLPVYLDCVFNMLSVATLP